MASSARLREPALCEEHDESDCLSFIGTDKAVLHRPHPGLVARIANALFSGCLAITASTRPIAHAVVSVPPDVAIGVRQVGLSAPCPFAHAVVSAPPDEPWGCDR